MITKSFGKLFCQWYVLTPYKFSFNATRFLEEILEICKTLFKIVIAWPPGYFTVLMLISYNQFYVTNCTNTLCSVDVSVSMVNGPSINVFDKSINFKYVDLGIQFDRK